MFMSETSIDTVRMDAVMVGFTITPIAGDVLHRERIVFRTYSRQHTCVSLGQAVH